MNKHRLVVTGAAGFIGSHLCSYFLHRGFSVVGVDNFLTGSEENLQEIRRHSRFEFHEANVAEPGVMKRIILPHDVVLHHAALGSVPRSIENPVPTHYHNATGFLEVAMACISNKAYRLIFASSSSVYGSSEALPKMEDELGKPLSPYAVSKLSNEMYGYVLGLHYNLVWIGLRYFNVFGENQQADNPYAAVIPRFIHSLKNLQRPVIYGDGLQARDFTYVQNVCLANEKAILAPKESCGKIYNIGCGRKTTLLELYSIIHSEVLKYRPEAINLQPEFRPARPGDIKHSWADISSAQRDLGYQPVFNITEGIQNVVKNFFI